MKEEWLFPGAFVPVDVETTSALVAEIKRLIDVVGGMALAQASQEPVLWMMPDGKTADKWALQFYGKQKGKPLYTTPPAAQREWVGLTDAEIVFINDHHYNIAFRNFEADLAIARATEAKLRNKNGWSRQHVTDGNPCWCEPETNYTDPETGASVIVHKEPQ